VATLGNRLRLPATDMGPNSESAASPGRVVAFTTDSNGNIQSWSREAEALFGYAADEIAGRSWKSLVAADLDDASVSKFRRRDRREFLARHATIPLTTGAGTVAYAQVIITVSSKNEAAPDGRGGTATTAELRFSEETRVRLLRRLVVAQEEERRRIARDLHDHLGQQLTSLRLKLEAVHNVTEAMPTARASLAQADALLTQIDRDIDFLSWELRPAALDDLGLKAVLENYVNEWSRHSRVPVRFHTDGLADARVAPEIEATLYRIAQEALTNVARHARAKSVSVVLERREHTMSLVIEDDGVGFDSSTISNTMIGLVGMRERAEVVGGSLDIEPTAGGGVTVLARVPLALTDHAALAGASWAARTSDGPGGDLPGAETPGRAVELQRAVAARDDFIATVAHELRNPIAPLMFQIRLSIDKTEQMERAGQPVSGDWVRGQLRRIEHRLHRLLETLDRLLDVSRLSSGRIDLEFDSVDMAEVIHDVVASFEAELAVARCDARIMTPSSVMGWWDRLRLDQICRNLVSNAVRFGAGHPIDVIVSADDDDVTLMVRDYGIGIPPHKQQVIFERFERGPETTRSGGFGVGLWVVRNLCTAMGGTIAVESSVGNGATFTVTLPRRQSREQRRGEIE